MLSTKVILKCILCLLGLTLPGCALTGKSGETAHWTALVDQGCKPGVAYEVWTERGVPQRGAISILDPTSWDGKAPLGDVVRVVAPLRPISTQDGTLMLQVPENIFGALPESVSFSLKGSLGGPVGTKVAASVRLGISEGHEEKVHPSIRHQPDIEFVRVE